MTYEELLNVKPVGRVEIEQDGKTYSTFVCFGCQSCLFLKEDDSVGAHYPHFIAPFEEVK